MKWKPIDRDELQRWIERGLDAGGHDTRALFVRIVREPAKWQLHPWGDLGGGFWVVAVLGNRVVWFNDIEGGHAGIALATSLAGVINAALLWRALRRAGLLRPRPGWGGYLLRLLFGCVAMSAVVLAVRHYAGGWPDMAPTVRLAWLGLAIASGAATYGAALFASGWRPRALREHG